MKKKLFSIFTDNMNRCLVTGIEATEENRNGIEIHHIFSGTDRPRGARLDMKTNWTDLDHWLKRKCQEYFIEVAQMGNKDDWYRLFGRFYDDRADENVWLNKNFEWRL